MIHPEPSIPKMVDISLRIPEEDTYHDMIYFPLEVQDQIPIIISAIPTTLVVSLSLIFRLYRRPLSLMVLAINIAHVFFYYTKMSVLVFPPQSGIHCKILSIFNVFSFESAAIWGALFAHAFYTILKDHSFNEFHLPRMIKFYLIFGVLIPLVNGVLSFFTDRLIYSESKGACVHRVYADRIDTWVLVFTLIPIGLSCFMSMVWYKMAMNKISALQGKETGGELYVLMIYPGILLLCWGPSLLTQIVMQFGVNPSTTLINIGLALVNSEGLLDSVVYGRFLRDVLRDTWNNYFKKSIIDEDTFIEQQIIISGRLSKESRTETRLLSDALDRMAYTPKSGEVSN